MLAITLTNPPGGSDSKESTCNLGEVGSIPGLGQFPREEHGNPLQYFCLETPHGQRSLAGYSPWGHKELGRTEWQSVAQNPRLGENLLPMQEMPETLVRSLGQERVPGVENGNTLLYSCLEISMGRGTWHVQSMGLQRVRHSWAQHNIYLTPPCELLRVWTS